LVRRGVKFYTPFTRYSRLSTGWTTGCVV